MCREMILAAISLLLSLPVGGEKRATANQPLEAAIASQSATVPSVASRKQVTGILGGTVNIILANRAGLVAVTDSRLSAPGLRPGTGTKLFKLDDHTLCMIAGWYSSDGPTVDGVHYPLYEAIPTIINQVAIEFEHFNHFSLSEKLEVVSGGVLVALDRMDTLARVRNLHVPVDSQITIVSYEDGQAKIATADIVRNDSGELMKLNIIYKPIITTQEKLIYSVAGVKDVAESYLSLYKLDKRDPILSNYFQNMSKDGGRALGLDDMVLIAKKLARLTEQKSPQVVGDPLQIATIDHGVVTIVEKPDFPEETVRSPYGHWIDSIDDMHVEGTESQHKVLFAFSPGSHFALILTNSKLAYVDAPLHDVFIFHTTFRHCQFTYDGTSTFILDNSNDVEDSTLVIPDGVSRESEGVKRIVGAFPQLKLVVTSK
jgi:hypothetical protein